MGPGRMSWSGANSLGITASSLADAAAGGGARPLGEPGRRCVTCGKLLTRLNLETACYACQAGRNEQVLRGQAAPATAEKALQSLPPWRRRKRAEQ